MGQDSRDEATFVRAPVKLLRVPLEPPAANPRLAVVRTPKWNVATQAQQSHFDECVARLAGAGAAIKEVNLPRLFDAAWDNVMVIMSVEAVKSFA